METNDTKDTKNPPILGAEYNNPALTTVKPVQTSQSAPVTINASTLSEPVKPIELPQYGGLSAKDYQAVIQAAIAGAKTNQTNQTNQTFTTPNGTVVDAQGNPVAPVSTSTTPAPTETTMSRFNNILSALGLSSKDLTTKPVSSEEKLRQLQEEQGLLAKQQKVQDLNAQLDELNTEAAIQTKSLEGQGRGQTIGFLNAQANQIEKERAFRALRISAELNVAQGRLDSAERNIDRMLQLQQADYQALKQYNDTIYERAWNFASAEQQDKLTEWKTRKDAESAKNQELLDAKNDAKNEALKQGDYESAARIAAANSIEEVSRLIGGIKAKPSLDDEYKRLQIQKLQGEISGTSGGGNVPDSYQAERMFRTIQSVDELALKARQSPGIFGATAALPIPSAFRSNAFRNFKAELDTLKSSIAFGELTAMREASKTGGALGQVSDREGKLLESALGALEMSQSPENFQKQLAKIKASIQRWQNSVQNSNNFQNVIKAPNGEDIVIID